MILKVWQLFGLMGGWFFLVTATYTFFWFQNLSKLQIEGYAKMYDLGLIDDGFLIDSMVQFANQNYYLPVLLGGWLLLIIGNHMER